MRVLMASKILVVAAYRRKLEELAAEPDIEELLAVTPPAWQEPGGRKLVFESAACNGYELRIEPIRFNGSYHLFHWRSLGRLIAEFKPDLVHMDEEAYNLATLLGMRGARRVGARSVFFTWQNLLRRYPPPFNFFEQYVFKSAAHAIAGSGEALSVLRSKGFTGPASVIPQFGVDPELFTPNVAREGAPVIGFVARLVEEKGIFVLLEALAGLAGDWALHVIGSGPLKARAQQRAAELAHRAADRVGAGRPVDRNGRAHAPVHAAGATVADPTPLERAVWPSADGGDVVWRRGRGLGFGRDTAPDRRRGRGRARGGRGCVALRAGPAACGCGQAG